MTSSDSSIISVEDNKDPRLMWLMKHVSFLLLQAKGWTTAEIISPFFSGTLEKPEELVQR